MYECYDVGNRHRCFTQKQSAEQYCSERNDEPYTDGFPCFVEEVPSHQELTVDNLLEFDIVDVENELFSTFLIELQTVKRLLSRSRVEYLCNKLP